jgi:hypothetical protein
MAREEPVFPTARWVALAWLAVWLPAYLWKYGSHVLLNLCDIAVILTCVGLWTGNRLLLSSQALSSLVVDMAWNVDLLARATTGQHLIGGTEYMWDAKWPLWLRALSAFHVGLPVALVWAVRRTGYHRRALPLQALIALVVLVASRVALGPEENQNFAWRDPFLGRAWGQAYVHVGLTWAVLVGAVYAPTHALLSRLMPLRSGRGASPRAGAGGSPA